MESFGVCLLLVCYTTTVITVKGSAQENNNVQLQYGDAIAKYIALYYPFLYVDGDILVPIKTQFADLSQSAKARPSSAVVNLKRGNQFKNFMLGRETSKDAVNQVQKGSYIPVKSNGKRGNSSPGIYGMYTGSDDMDIFQKWLSSYYLQ